MPSYRRAACLALMLLAARADADTCFAEATSDDGARACVIVRYELPRDIYELLPTTLMRFECLVESRGSERTLRWHHEVEKLFAIGGPVVGDVRWCGSDVVVAFVISMAPNVRLEAWRFSGEGDDAPRRVAEASWDTKLYEFGWVGVRVLDDAVVVEATVGERTWSAQVELEPPGRAPERGPAHH